MKKLTMILVIVQSSVAIFSYQAMAEDASPIAWVSPFGTDSADYSVWISVDATGNYIDGYTDDVSPKQTGASSEDTFISRHNPDSKAIFTISSDTEGTATITAIFGECDHALTSTATKKWI